MNARNVMNIDRTFRKAEVRHLRCVTNKFCLTRIMSVLHEKNYKLLELGSARFTTFAASACINSGSARL